MHNLILSEVVRGKRALPLTGRPVDDIGSGKGADLLPHCFNEVLPNGVAEVVAIMQRHIRVYALPLDIVIKPAPEKGIS